MLSPLELENKRILTNKRRYDRFEMDEYLDMVFENYKELFNEYEEQKKQIKTLSEGIQYYRSIESTMQKALLLAEKTSKETKDAAILKAEAIEKDANNKAAQIVGTAEQEYTRIREKCIELVTQFNNYKAQLQVAANEQLRLITSTTFDIETPVIDKEENVSASGLEAVSAETEVNAEVPAQEPVVNEIPQQPIEQPQEAPDIPAEPVQEEQIPAPKPVMQSIPEPQVQPEPQQVSAPQVNEPEPMVRSFNEQPAMAAAPTVTEITAQSTEIPETVREDKPKSSVYSFSAPSSNTNPIPDLSGVLEPEQVVSQQPSYEPDQATVQPQFDSIQQPQAEPQDVSSQFEMYTDVSSAELQPKISPEPVSEKTMVLPDVKDVDRASLRPSRNYTEEEQLQILSAETINLDDSIKAVKEKEMLEVPKREEPEQLTLEAGQSEAPITAQPKTGLDTILQSMTIGKKKKANGESAEDPFEFLGSVDDF